MRKRKTARRTSIAAITLLAAGAPALAADSLSDSIEQFLQNTQTKLDETKIWKFHIKPSLRESVIWTDNVFLNDDGENNVQLLSVTDKTTKVVTTNPARLDRIAAHMPEFNDTATEGRQSDFIIQSDLGLDFTIPVNPSYSKAFRVNDQMTLLGVHVKNQEYLDNNDLDNTSVTLRSDLFGFLSDLLNVSWGNGFWVRARDDYSQLKDPLDTTIRQLRRDGLGTIRTFRDFSRTENTANLDVGYNGNLVDVTVGYEHYQLLLQKAELRQAEHTRQNVHVEAGMPCPEWEAQRVFMRWDYWNYNFARADVYDTDSGLSSHSEQILNDADVFRGVIGIEGPMISDKMAIRIENGYESWSPGKEAPQGGDRNHFSKWVGLVRAAYSPWDESERNTKFQLQYKRSVGYSAISNFNAEHDVRFSVFHEVMPKRLDADMTIAFTSTVPSNGPVRHLVEAGVGATYHMYKQFDVSLRYLIRHETTNKEIETNSAFEKGNNLFQYRIQSNGAFVQNIVELAFLLHF